MPLSVQPVVAVCTYSLRLGKLRQGILRSVSVGTEKIPLEVQAAKAAKCVEVLWRGRRSSDFVFNFELSVTRL